jgi:hypothetical protein
LFNLLIFFSGNIPEDSSSSSYSRQNYNQEQWNYPSFYPPPLQQYNPHQYPSQVDYSYSLSSYPQYNPIYPNYQQPFDQVTKYFFN